MQPNNSYESVYANLSNQWRAEANGAIPDCDLFGAAAVNEMRDQYIAQRAAEWGADQELAKCCAALSDHCEGGRNMYSCAGEWLYSERRRNFGPNANEQAIDVVVKAFTSNRMTAEDATLLLRSLGQIRD